MPLRTIQELDKQWDIRILTQDAVAQLLEQFGTQADRYLLGRNIYVVSRLFGIRGMQAFLDGIHGANGLVVFDTDDDLTEEFRDIDGRGEEFIYCIKKMDLVTVSTPYLAKRIERHIGYKPPVLYNHVDCYTIKKVNEHSKRAVPELTLGFIGTSSHYGDWVFPMEALHRIGKEYPEVRIISGGYQPDYLTDLPNYQHFDPVPIDHYPKLVSQFDIICCSLDPDDEFNKSKSSIKALEAMASGRRLPNGQWGGAVAVCTDMPVYRRTVNHRHNGLLTENDSWYETLKELIENKRLRYKLSVNGHKWVKKNRDIRGGYRAWIEVYKNLLKGRSQ